MHRQNTINDEDELIRRKYILNNTKTVIRGFQSVIVEEAGLPGSCAV
jgi:hypothetical protein